MQSSELTKEQRRFLHELLQFGSSCDDLVERLQLKPWRLGCWFRDTKFRNALAERVKDLRRRSDLNLPLAARDALSTLHKMVKGEIPVDLEKAITCIKIIELCFKHRPRRRKRRGDAAPSVDDLAHPSISKHRADELLKSLEQARKQHAEAESNTAESFT